MEKRENVTPTIYVEVFHGARLAAHFVSIIFFSDLCQLLFLIVGENH